MSNAVNYKIQTAATEANDYVTITWFYMLADTTEK